MHEFIPYRVVQYPTGNVPDGLADFERSLKASGIVYNGVPTGLGKVTLALRSVR